MSQVIEERFVQKGNPIVQARCLILSREFESPPLPLKMRSETRPGPTQNSAVIGIQGMAPYEFDFEGALYLRGGRISGRFEAEVDQLLAQRWILQPRIETNFAGASDRERGIGTGFTDVQLGLRLRYEIRREIAPYIGISWTRRLGDTADIARGRGDRVTGRGVVLGLRLWY